MDMVIFCKEANKAGKKAIACIDGEYGKREIKNKLTENDNCLILDTDELVEGIKNGRFN